MIRSEDVYLMKWTGHADERELICGRCYRRISYDDKEAIDRLQLARDASCGRCGHTPATCGEGDNK